MNTNYDFDRILRISGNLSMSDDEYNACEENAIRMLINARDNNPSFPGVFAISTAICNTERPFTQENTETLKQYLSALKSRYGDEYMLKYRIRLLALHEHKEADWFEFLNQTKSEEYDI